MKKVALAFVFLLLMCSSAWADTLTLTATAGVNGGKDVYTLDNITFGTTLTFEYQFLEVTWGGQGQPFLNVNGKDSIDFSDYNDYQNAVTGLLLGTIDTSGVSGQIGSVTFTADTFNGTGNYVKLLIQNVRVDGQIVAFDSTAVPEPATLLLLAPGLSLVLLRRLRRR